MAILPKSVCIFRQLQMSASIEHEQQKRLLGDQDWVVTANPTFSYEKRGDNASRISIGYDYSRSNDLFRFSRGNELGKPGEFSRGHWHAVYRLGLINRAAPQ